MIAPKVFCLWGIICVEKKVVFFVICDTIDKNTRKIKYYWEEFLWLRTSSMLHKRRKTAML